MYLHIPFCRKRCRFCYFRVYTDKNSDEVQTYCDALAREVDAYAALPAVQGRELRFVYFGGGTPSYIAAKHLTDLVGRIRGAFGWDQVEEVTFECEPGTLSRTKLETIRELGMTRLSLGVEHFNDEILQLNGRAHVSTEIERVLPWIQELDFPQFNLDLIAGMMGETWETWRDAVSRGPSSRTPTRSRFIRWNCRSTRASLRSSWRARSTFRWPTGRRSASGISTRSSASPRPATEVSSAYTMVKSDKPCNFRYRDSLWHGADMLGTGVSSFGHVGGVHAQNSANWAEYLEMVGAGDFPVKRALVTTPEEQLVREFILQMKTGHVPASYFADKFGVDVLDKFSAPLADLEKQGMLRVADGAVQVTPVGMLQVDGLLPSFYDEQYRNARYT